MCRETPPVSTRGGGGLTMLPVVIVGVMHIIDDVFMKSRFFGCIIKKKYACLNNMIIVNFWQ